VIVRLVVLIALVGLALWLIQLAVGNAALVLVIAGFAGLYGQRRACGRKSDHLARGQDELSGGASGPLVGTEHAECSNERAKSYR
jgi:hypothetical protein